MIKHLIFDFDGTISNTYPHVIEFYHRFAEEHGLELNETDEWLLHTSLITISEPYRAMGWDQKISYSEFAEAFETMQRQKATEFRPFPEAVDLLKYAAEKGIRNYVYTHSGKVVPEKILPSMGIDGYITFTIDVSMNFPRKPAPDALLFLKEKFHLNLDECMMIGDRPIDAICGMNAGMKGCLWDAYGIFADASVDVYIRKLEDVKKYI